MIRRVIKWWNQGQWWDETPRHWLPSVSAIKWIQDMIDHNQSKLDLLVRSLHQLGWYYSTGLNNDSHKKFHDKGSSKADPIDIVDQGGKKMEGGKSPKPFKKSKEILIRIHPIHPRVQMIRVKTLTHPPQAQVMIPQTQYLQFHPVFWM